MFYAKLKQDGQIVGNLYHDFQDYVNDTFSPEVETLEIVSFTVHGKNYRERRADVEDKAIICQNDYFDPDVEIDMLDWTDISSWFEKMGERYGLLKEFRENCVC